MTDDSTNCLQARGVASAERIAERSLDWRVGVWGTKSTQLGPGTYLKLQARSDIALCFVNRNSSVESNLERLAEGFGFVQSCLRPQSGVTWLGCDAAVQQCRGASTRRRFDALSSQSRPDDGRCGDYAVYLKHGRQDTSFMQF